MSESNGGVDGTRAGSRTRSGSGPPEDVDADNTSEQL